MGINKVQINRNGQTETIIDLTQDTVTEETLLEGVVAHGADGEPIIGTFTPKLQDKTITENGAYQADSGFDGLGSVTVEVAGSGGGSGGGCTFTKLVFDGVLTLYQKNLVGTSLVVE